MANLKDVVFDCLDPWGMAHWWAPFLGYHVRQHNNEDIAALASVGIYRVEDDPSIVIDPPEGRGPSTWFNRVPSRLLARTVFISTSTATLWRSRPTAPRQSNNTITGR